MGSLSPCGADVIVEESGNKQVNKEMSRSFQGVLRSVLKISEPGIKTKNERGPGAIVDWVVGVGLSELTCQLSPEEEKELALERAYQGASSPVQRPWGRNGSDEMGRESEQCF